MALFSDDESKETYRKCVIFRQTYKNSDLPKDNSYKKQYFGNDFFKYHEDEVFVDCGAFDGDTVRKFKKVMKKNGVNRYKCVCFEPDDKNYKALKNNCPESIPIKCGVWNESGNLYFSSGEGDSSCLLSDDMGITDNVVKVSVVALDDIPECQNASFIKMDIEGAEKNAIQGAKRIIKENKPKLAICIYHSDDDMIDIPFMIHEMVPEYKLYVRHHSNSCSETVLYATT